MDETILLGIDGTGELSDAVYEREMHNSFVNYIVRQSPAKWKKYIRGPGFDGLDMGMVVGEAYSFVHLHKFSKRSGNRVVPESAARTYSLISCSRSITSRTVSQRLSATSS
jgi:hypothetical protein